MALATYFYHGLFKKAVQIFGSRFDGLQIKRDDGLGNLTTVNVPIQYAPIQKELARLQADPTGQRSSNIILPRISFEITDIQRDSTRMISKTNRISDSGTDYYVGVPYNLTFQMNVIAKNMEDSLKIVEQILPYFNPHLALKAQLIDSSTELFDIPLELQSVALNDTYEGDFLTRRAVIWNLIFVMRYQFFGPSSTTAQIKFVKTTTYSDSAMTQKDLEYQTYPGLTANGTPTTDPANTVPYSAISATDDYGFIFVVNEDPYANT